MAAATLKIFLEQNLATQYVDLKTAGVLKAKDSDNYRDKEERYTFLTANFTVKKKSGVVTEIQMDCAKVPALA
jgi:hypothetical protein